MYLDRVGNWLSSVLERSSTDLMDSYASAIFCTVALPTPWRELSCDQRLCRITSNNFLIGLKCDVRAARTFHGTLCKCNAN